MTRIPTDGRGVDSDRVCRACEGRGIFHNGYFAEDCPDCGGCGYVWNAPTVEEELDRIERSHPDYEATMTRLINEAFEPNDSLEYVRQGEVYEWLSSLIED